MKKIYHKKLIRDKIPEKIKESGGAYKTRVLKGLEFEKALRTKLVEESQEVEKSSKSELINELSDVLELTKVIASYYKIPFSKIERFQQEKRKKRGSFRKKLFLIWSTGKSVNNS